MFQQSYSIGGERDLTLNVEHGGGDLHLLGTDETYLRIQGEGEADEYDLDYQHGTLTLSLHEDCAFFIPRQVNLRVTGTFGGLHVSELAGDLTIEGGQGDVVLNAATGAVQLESVMGDLRANQLGSLSIRDGVRGHASITDVAGAVAIGDVADDLNIAEVGSLAVSGNVSGSAKIASVRGAVSLGDVAGDLGVRDVENFSATDVDGNLRASNIVGDFSVASVSGDAKIESVTGALAMFRVGGDARVSDVEGKTSSCSASGDLYLQADLGAEGKYEFSAGGDLVLALPADAAAQFECTAGGEVVNRFGGQKTKHERGVWQGQIGEGGPMVRLQAGGDVKIKPQEGGNVEFRIEINQEEMKHAKEEMKRAKEEMKRLKHELKDQIRGGFDPEKLRDEIHRSVQHGLRGMRFSYRGPRPPHPSRVPGDISLSFGPFGSSRKESAPSASPSRVSDEERLTILKMLEEKQITPEQAEALLNALGDE